MAGLEGRRRPSLTFTPTRSTAQAETGGMGALTEKSWSTVWTTACAAMWGAFGGPRRVEERAMLVTANSTGTRRRRLFFGKGRSTVNLSHVRPSLVHPKHYRRLVVPFAPYLLQDKPSVPRNHTHPAS